MKRFWVSWWEPAVDGDARPLIVPPKSDVPHYWITGWRDGNDGDEASVCAIVDASDEDAARETVARYWVPGEERFIYETRRSDAG